MKNQTTTPIPPPEKADFKAEKNIFFFLIFPIFFSRRKKRRRKLKTEAKDRAKAIPPTLRGFIKISDREM